MDYDKDKVDDMTLALLFLVSSKLPDGTGARAWGGLNPDVVERLHERGYIEAPSRKATSLHLTSEGYERSRLLFEATFTTTGR